MDNPFINSSGNPFRNVAGETSGMENPPEFRRASGSVICKTCGKEYRKHSTSNHVDWDGNTFLNQLCNGDLVKL